MAMHDIVDIIDEQGEKEDVIQIKENPNAEEDVKVMDESIVKKGMLYVEEMTNTVSNIFSKIEEINIPADNDFNENPIVIKNGVAYTRNLNDFIKLGVKPVKGNILVKVPGTFKREYDGFNIEQKMSILKHNGMWWQNMISEPESFIGDSVPFNV